MSWLIRYVKKSWDLLLLGLALLIVLGFLSILYHKPKYQYFNAGYPIEHAERSVVMDLQSIVSRYHEELLSYLQKDSKVDEKLSIALEEIGIGSEMWDDYEFLFNLEGKETHSDVLTDSWGNQYLLVMHRDENGDWVEVISAGEDGNRYLADKNMIDDDIKGESQPTVPDYYSTKRLKDFINRP